ncbi:MAG: YecA family protein [Motiliproteus sp.]
MSQSPVNIDKTPLDENEMEELESFIFSPAVSEESLDYLGIHGLLTALAVSPVEVPREEWLDVIFDGAPGYADEAQQQRIQSLLIREYLALCDELNDEEAPELPCELTLNDDEDDSLTVWSQGFMEGVFLRESEWFDANEELLAEMLLPIMLASELFDEPEFQEIRDNENLCQQFCNEIPELITDLYLHFRVPEDTKPNFNKGGKKSANKGPQKGPKKR